MFKIGDFSRLTQVTVKTLRHYDSLGLLEPAQIDPDTSYRYYTSEQIPRLNRILALKDFGFSLDQIGKLLDADLSAEQLRAMLLSRQEEVQRTIEEERARLARIEARLLQIERGDDLPHVDVVLKRVEERQVASIRRLLPQRSAIRELFGELFAYVGRHGIQPGERAVIWHDPDFRESEIDAEATFGVDGAIPGDPRVDARLLPAVDTMACVIHHGLPAMIGPTCMALAQWIDTSGYEIAGPERVKIVHGPGRHLSDGPGSGRAIVELQFPVRRSGEGT